MLDVLVDCLNSPITLVSLVAFVLPLCLVYLHDKNSRSLLSKIPGPAYRFPVIGHLPMFWTSFNSNDHDKHHSLMVGLAQLYKKHGIFKFQLGPIPSITIFRYDLVEDFLKDNTNLEKPREYQILKNWLGRGLLINDDSVLWRQRRKLLTPAFHFKIIEQFVPIVSDQSNTLIENLTKHVDQEAFDVVPYLFSCALDTICETAMGTKMNFQQNKNQEYFQIVHRMAESFIERLTKPWLLPDIVFYRTEMGRQMKRNLKFAHNFTTNVVKERKESLIKSKASEESNAENKEKKRKQLAFLDLLLELHLKDNSLTLEDIREEVDTFMFAGHDTTACCLSSTLYLLGFHPDVQLRAQQELDTIVTKDEEITIEHIKQMAYIEAVIKESLRIYPPVPIITRKITKDLKIGDYLVPSGTSLNLVITALHSDPNVFPEPLKYRPERFLGGDQRESPFVFTPFSAGARSCIGQKFAMNELKVILAKMLLNFSWQSLQDRSDLLISSIIVQKPKSVKIKLTARP